MTAFSCSMVHLFALAAVGQLPRFAALIMLLSGLAANDLLAAPGPRSTGRILVQPREGVDPGALQNWSANHHIDTMRFHPHSGNLHVMRSDVLGEDEVIAKLLESGLVEYAEPDYIVRASILPNDSAINTGAAWAISKIGLATAWDHGTSASNVVVAIVDSGIRLTHEDLKDNLWTNPNEIAGNGIDDDRDGIVDDVHGMNALSRNGNIADDVGHGTHVAGIIGAAGNNSKGSAGVVWKVQLMPLKFMDKSGEGSTLDAIACIDYARIHGAQIINASWGSPATSQALGNAVSRARTAGIIFVAAAGNDGLSTDSSPTYPADYLFDNLISVGASDRYDRLATFSNYGAGSVHLLAPGVSIYSTWDTSNSAYKTLDGTSMAAPYVTGAFALLKARFPEKSYTDLIDAVLKSVDPISAARNTTISGGRLNVAAALDFLVPTAPALSISVSVTDNSFTLALTGSASTQLTVEQSADFQTWTPIGTVTLDSSGQTTLPISPSSENITVFRAVK